MSTRFASAYDQNPARLSIVMKRQRSADKRAYPAMIGIQLLMAFAAATICGYMVI
jgi:hypothetical protein